VKKLTISKILIQSARYNPLIPATGGICGQHFAHVNDVNVTPDLFIVGVILKENIFSIIYQALFGQSGRAS